MTYQQQQIPTVDNNAKLKIESAPLTSDTNDEEKFKKIKSMYNLFLIGTCIASFIAGSVLTFAIFYFEKR